MAEISVLPGQEARIDILVQGAGAPEDVFMGRVLSVRNEPGALAIYLEGAFDVGETVMLKLLFRQPTPQGEPR